MVVKRRIGDLGEDDGFGLHFYKDLAEPLEEFMQSIENLSPNENTRIESLLLGFKDVYKTKAISFLLDINKFTPTVQSDANDGSTSLNPDAEDGSSVEEDKFVKPSVTADSDDEDISFGEEGQDFESIVHLSDNAEPSSSAKAVGPNRENMVNISGLDYKLTEVQIKEIFENKFGKIEKVLVSKFSKGPTNCGWASITFANGEAMEKCIGFHKKKLQGHKLDIKRASKQTQNNTIKSVFCAGFNLNGKEEIQQALTKSLENIGVTPTGFDIKQRCAFVHFGSSLHADTAVQSSGLQLENGQAVIVDYNLKKRSR